MQKGTIVGICLAAVGLAGLLTGTGVAAHYRRAAATAESERAAMAAAHALCTRMAAARTVAPEAPMPASATVKAGSSLDLLADRDTRIAELEDLLNERDAQLRALESALAARPGEAAGGTNDTRRDRGRAFLDQMRANAPQLVEEMAQRHEEARQQIAAAITERMEKLKSRDTSTMSEEDRNAYSLMVQLLDDTWRMGEQLSNAEIPREERGAIMEKLRANISDLRPMMDAERTREFVRIGVEAGYNAEEAAAFATRLNDVIDTTSIRSVIESGMQGFGGFGRRGRSGGGSGTGGGGRDAGGMAPP